MYVLPLDPTVALQKLHLFTYTSKHVTIIEVDDRCLVLFSGGPASGHHIHRGGVCVQDSGHREEEAL